jgi:macrolide-specific efflux system membrane fusion protein
MSSPAQHAQNPENEPGIDGGASRAGFGARFGKVALGAGLALAVLIGGGVWAYQRTRPTSVRAERRLLAPILSLAGTVVVPPDQTAWVMAPFAAPVEKVSVTLGQNVSLGDVLVELSVPDSEAGLRTAQQQSREAETALANAQQVYGTEVTSAKARYAAARSVERAAREQPALPDGTAAPAAPGLEEATQGRLAAEQAMLAAVAAREAALLPYRGQIAATREALRLARAGERLNDVRSPIKGTVLSLNAKPGDMAGADVRTPLAVVTDLDALQMHVLLAPEDVAVATPGREGELAFADLPGKQFGVRLESVVTQPAEDNVTGYLAILRIDNEGGAVKPGMQGAVALKLGEPREVLAVPQAAVGKDRTGRPTVQVLEGGAWRTRVVEVGAGDGVYREIRSGLTPGQTIQVRRSLLP